MLIGTRETFAYFECGGCDCVQIAAIPGDLERHYPPSYFSFRDWTALARHPIRRRIDPLRVKRAFGGASAIGRFAERVSRPLDYIDWVRAAGLDAHARILDIGCGAGKTLVSMALGGFPTPTGVDPFIARPIHYPIGIVIEKTTIEVFTRSGRGPFDLVMFHHSLEHLPDPGAALAAARTLLSEKGRILVVVPVAGAYAWRKYGANWCNLDPPRHLHLFTRPALDILAAQSGLAIEWTRSVGALSQFVGSERYLLDIPASDPRPDRAIFSQAQIAHWKRETERLNREGQGDQMMLQLRAA
ncbi:MAG: class I SAM-dependent methyltransferase [Caulobacteraceae bacterium]